jgi:hypothetical protein
MTKRTDALAKLLRRTIDNDRYPLSPRWPLRTGSLTGPGRCLGASRETSITQFDAGAPAFSLSIPAAVSPT